MTAIGGTHLEKSLKLQEDLRAARRAYHRGEGSLEALYAAADAFIEFLKEYKEASGNKKLRIPTRSYLIRAL